MPTEAASEQLHTPIGMQNVVYSEPVVQDTGSTAAAVPHAVPASMFDSWRLSGSPDMLLALHDNDADEGGQSRESTLAEPHSEAMRPLDLSGTVAAANSARECEPSLTPPSSPRAVSESVSRALWVKMLSCIVTPTLLLVGMALAFLSLCWCECKCICDRRLSLSRWCRRLVEDDLSDALPSWVEQSLGGHADNPFDPRKFACGVIVFLVAVLLIRLWPASHPLNKGGRTLLCVTVRCCLDNIFAHRERSNF